MGVCMNSDLTGYGKDAMLPMGRPRTSLLAGAMALVALAVSGGFLADAILSPRAPAPAALAWSGALPTSIAPMAPATALLNASVEPKAPRKLSSAGYDLVFGPSVQALSFIRPEAPQRAERPVREAAAPANPALEVPLPPRAPERAAPEKPVVDAPVRTAELPVPPPNPFRPRALMRTSEPKEPARRVVASASPDETNFFQKLFGSLTPAPNPALAYARTEEPGLNSLTPVVPRMPQVDGSRTAVYDIEAKVVIMPDGTRLEAHSGLGEHLDDPSSISIRMRGATPPNVYELSMREQLFHGVRALRMTPTDNSRMYGRDGILAHTFMLGPRGDSNGCISFRDYDQFLQAYLRGEVKRIVVVTRAGLTVAQRLQQRG